MNVSSLGLIELDHQFKTADLFEKLANIDDDFGKGYIKESSISKKLSKGKTLNVEKQERPPTIL